MKHNWTRESVEGHSGDGSGMLVHGTERCMTCGARRHWSQSAQDGSVSVGPARDQYTDERADTECAGTLERVRDYVAAGVDHAGDYPEEIREHLLAASPALAERLDEIDAAASHLRPGAGYQAARAAVYAMVDA